jgi:hypothetical protein
MYHCNICHADVLYDDVEVSGPASQCICVRCYRRETDTTRPMPAQLQRALRATLRALDAA